MDHMLYQRKTHLTIKAKLFYKYIPKSAFGS